MDQIYSIETLVYPSMTDHTARLGVPNIFSLFMDIASEQAEVLGFGADDMMKQGLFWLTVKTKVKIHTRPKLMERITVKTWPGRPERFRCPRYYQITKGDELLVEGKTEWAVLDTQSGKLSPANDIYPAELPMSDRTTCEGSFCRIRPDFSGAEKLRNYTVRSTDIDLGRHMNNAAYLRTVFGAISTADKDAFPVHEADALFKAPCYEGDTLTIYKREDGTSQEYGLVQEDGQAAFLLRIS